MGFQASIVDLQNTSIWMLLSVEEAPGFHFPPSFPQHGLDLCSLPGCLLRVLTPCLAAEER